MQLCTQEHDDESTVSAKGGDLKLSWQEGSWDALFSNLSRMRYARPFHYGHVEYLVYLLIFENTYGIRFIHSPTGGWYNNDFNTTNPAWDWQFIVP